MEPTVTIYEQQPNTKFKKILIGIILSTVAYLIVAGTTIDLTILSVVMIGFILGMNFLLESQFYDGLSVSNNIITISKNTIFRGKVEHRRSLENISRITFIKGGRYVPEHIIIESELNPLNIKVSINENIFKFAYCLRELKRKNIEVNLKQFDHEIQLFLDERIPELPMTNDMEIR